MSDSYAEILNALCDIADAANAFVREELHARQWGADYMFPSDEFDAIVAALGRLNAARGSSRLDEVEAT